ncbi:MAG: FecR domain-containing protein [Bacteroidota bacterium]
MAAHNNLSEAIDHYLDGTASGEERELVNTWYHAFDDEQTVIPVVLKNYKEIANKKLKERIEASTGVKISPMETPVKKVNYFSYAAACAAVLLISITLILYVKKQGDRPASNAMATLDLRPGGYNAILTLSDGKAITLDSTATGNIPAEQKTMISQSGNGQIVYQPVTATSQVYNHTLTTPLGGLYQLKLSDGTKIWLNAGSTIKYPSQFSGNERKVSLTGEAYFEVAKNKGKPFRVVCQDQTIEVLGTHFNIKTYSDKSTVKTSLLEGSVKVNHRSEELVLKPGQQSSLDPQTGLLKKQVMADADAALAWKNGEFNFDSADIQSIMSEFSRWYNVEVVFQGPAPVYHLSGTYKRTLNGAALLKVFQLTGLHFTVEGRKIIISQ